MNRKWILSFTLICLTIITLNFNACIYGVQTNSGSLYINKRGAVFLDKASDVNSITLSGYYEIPGAKIELVCYNSSGAKLVIDRTTVNTNFTYNLTAKNKSIRPEVSCVRPIPEQVQLYVTIEGTFAPILTNDNTDCIGKRLQMSPGKTVLTANNECLLKGDDDARYSTNKNGFNKTPDHVNTLSVYLYKRLTYLGKKSNITDFRGYGNYMYYFPAFGMNTIDDNLNTNDFDVYLQGLFKKFTHCCFDVSARTFSWDHPTKARGGHADWPSFILPNGTQGLSGTIYDDYTRSNSNNTVNQIKLHSGSPKEFCLSIITDNTNMQNIPDIRLKARTEEDYEDVSLEGHVDLVFDGKPDMYMFKYRNMTNDGKIKIQMKSSGSPDTPLTGAGIGGIMISDVANCL